MTPRWLPALTVVLALGLVATAAGWFLSGREGAGTPIDCYAIQGDALSFSPVHGALTTKATITVEESDSRVVVGFWDHQSSTSAHDSAYAVDVSYLLSTRLGNRPVVDPAGLPIRKC